MTGATGTLLTELLIGVKIAMSSKTKMLRAEALAKDSGVNTAAAEIFWLTTDVPLLMTRPPVPLWNVAPTVSVELFLVIDCVITNEVGVLAVTLTLPELSEASLKMASSSRVTARMKLLFVSVVALLVST